MQAIERLKEQATEALSDVSAKTALVEAQKEIGRERARAEAERTRAEEAERKLSVAETSTGNRRTIVVAVAMAMGAVGIGVGALGLLKGSDRPTAMVPNRDGPLGIATANAGTAAEPAPRRYRPPQRPHRQAPPPRSPQLPLRLPFSWGQLPRPKRMVLPASMLRRRGRGGLGLRRGAPASRRAMMMRRRPRSVSSLPGRTRTLHSRTFLARTTEGDAMRRILSVQLALGLSLLCSAVGAQAQKTCLAEPTAVRSC